MKHFSDIQAPAGYRIKDRRTGDRPSVQFQPITFARCPKITLGTYKRSLLVEGEYVTRHFWAVRTDAVAGMDEGALHDFMEALGVAQRLLVDLRAAEIASQPKRVLDAFEGVAQRRALPVSS